MSLTTYEMARILEQMEDSPEKIMFGKLLIELGNQSEDRIRRAAKQLPLNMLRDLIYQFQMVVESRKDEGVKDIVNALQQDGFTVSELIEYIEKKKK